MLALNITMHYGRDLDSKLNYIVKLNRKKFCNFQAKLTSHRKCLSPESETSLKKVNK